MTVFDANASRTGVTFTAEGGAIVQYQPIYPEGGANAVDAGNSTLPCLSGSGAGNVGIIGRGSGRLSLTSTGHGIAQASHAEPLPALTSSATGVVGVAGRGVSRLPALTEFASASAVVYGRARQNLAMSAKASGWAVALGAGHATIKRLSGHGSGCIILWGSAKARLSLFGNEAQGWSYGPGKGKGTLPMLTGRAHGHWQWQEPIKLAAMNMPLSAVSEYSLSPSGIAAYGDCLILAMPDGIYRAKSAKYDEGSTPIQSRIATGVIDLGSDANKRLNGGAYIAAEMDSDLSLSVIVDGEEYAYTVPDHGKTGVHESKAKLGRGLRSRYWQFALSGGRFSLQKITIDLSEGSRRV